MSNLKAVSNLTWADVESRIGQEKLDQIFTDLDILGLG